MIAGLCLAALLLPGCVQYYPSAALPAQPPPQPPPYPPGYAAQQTAQAPSIAPANGLDQLLAPIALYPDPLVALILPASTVPSDISAAEAFLVQYGDVTRVDGQPWDPSVRSLAHYPALIQWLADNPGWTQAVGRAFLASPQQVMASIQRLRTQAVARGLLVSTAQQQVYSDYGEIEILPGQPDSIYVPAYDAEVLYSADFTYGFEGPFIDFGPPFAVGPWLSFCMDWRSSDVWANGWGALHAGGAWHETHVDLRRIPPGMHTWQRPSRAPGPAPAGAPRQIGIPAPRPLRGAASGQARPGSPAPAGAAKQQAAQQPRERAPEAPAARPSEHAAKPAPAAHAEPAHESAHAQAAAPAPEPKKD